MPKIYSIDYETRSRADLKKVGAFRYANDPTTEILCFAIAEGDGEPVLWRRPLPGDHPGVNINEEAEHLLYHATQPDSLIYAHNAMFEIAISDALFFKTFELDPPEHHQWRCTMAMARRAALPVSLKRLAEALNLKQQKDASGSSLINKFSKPQTTGKRKGQFIEPQDDWEAFEKFGEYCRQDVRTEQEIHRVLKAFELKGFPLDTFLMDIEINTRGFPVNLDALAKVSKIVDSETEKLSEQFRNITGINPTQGVKLLAWLKERGFDRPNLKAETLEEVFEDEDFDETTDLGKALMIKKRISYASVKKVKAMLDCAGPHDNRIRGLLVYHGAGTGRWTATHVQPENFKRPSPWLEQYTEDAYRDICEGCTSAWLELIYGPPLEVISSSIRHFIQDLDGDFLDVDFAAVEARITAWQAQEQWRLDVFKSHGKIYEASACQMFGLKMADFDNHVLETGKNHPRRKEGKIAELALGFGGSVGALIAMGALKMGIKKEDLQPIVDAWREASPNIVKLGRDTENAARKAILNPRQEFHFGIGCSFFSTQAAGMPYLFLKLPSGRLIAYPRPEITKQLRWTTKDPKTGEEVNHKALDPTPEKIATVRQKHPKARLSDAITFFGQLPKSVQWGRCVGYSSTFLNNTVQGIAADLMANGVLKAEAKGYQIASLIHDEALAYFRPQLGQTSEEFTRLLLDKPDWADGLPLAAEGGAVPFYKK